MELMIIVAVAIHPVMGLARLWAMKTLSTAPAGSILHGVAEAVLIPVGTT